jgi:hypothetical protein
VNLQNKKSDQNMNVRHFSSGSSGLKRVPRHTSDDFVADSRRLEYSYFPIEAQRKIRKPRPAPPPTNGTFRKEAQGLHPSKGQILLIALMIVLMLERKLQLDSMQEIPREPL